jgi:hypothetical protein
MLENTKKIKHWVVDYLYSLDQLHLTIFSAYIQRDYFDEQVKYEKKLIKQTRMLLAVLKKIRQTIRSVPVKVAIKNPASVENLFQYDDMISCLEHLYEIFFSLDLLKQRLIDHATFEICLIELKNISAVISGMISNRISFIRDNIPVHDKNTLLLPIQALEVIFQNTMQFAMADPMVFLFFIRDLKALNDAMVSLQDEIKF